MWQPLLTDRYTEYRRFFVRAIGLILGITFGVFLGYVGVKFCCYGVDFLGPHHLR